MANGSPFSLLGDLNFFNQIGASSFFFPSFAAKNWRRVTLYLGWGFFWVFFAGLVG